MSEFDLYVNGMRRILGGEDGWVTDINIGPDTDGMIDMTVITFGPQHPPKTALVITVGSSDGVLEAQIRRYDDGCLVAPQTGRIGLVASVATEVK